MVDLGHWEGVLEENADLPYGFIYKITNLTNDKKYIGKKQCQSIRKRPPLKGKKNKRHEKIETDWKTYTSSSNGLNAHTPTGFSKGHPVGNSSSSVFFLA